MEDNFCLRKPEDCGEIISSVTLPLSSGVTITPVGINGPLVAKIPVVLAEREIQIDIESELRLNEPFLEIKRIKKTVFLTQCKLLPTSGVIENGILRSGKLFISGFVRKNIEYATADCIEDNIVSGRIAHTTIDVPFKLVTEVQYAVPPLVNVTTGDTTIFAEDPFCELEAVRIIEEDLLRDSITCHNKSDVELFENVIEKMVVYIRVKVLQLRQVNIPL